ncbi:uncharacterized protein PG998_003425 [Apiospora kogelbergensis]|uniref:Uncharacterized protein n=1 Tax=Apiospora kogelbergensis TaxID=1337665 RepID=A0AAW0QTD9_9PEZI
MCTGTIYDMIRCRHCIVHYTSHCRLYLDAHPPTEPSTNLLIPEPYDDPCPHIKGSNNNEPAVVVRLDDSCAHCMPRVHHWKVDAHKSHMADRVSEQAWERRANGDRLAAAAMRNTRFELDRRAQEQIATIDWSVVPAMEPAFPRSSWTVHDDKKLSAAWFGGELVWADEESLNELRYRYKKYEEKKRREEEEEGEDLDDEVEEVEVEVDEEDDDRSRYSYYSTETRTGYHISSDEFENQDRQLGTNSQSSHSSLDRPRQLRKRRRREMLGDTEFFSFSNLEHDPQDDRDESYHIDNDADDDIWFRAGSTQPRDGETSTTDSFPKYSRRVSQWTPDVTRAAANQSKRASAQAVRGSKKYDLKPFIPSQHQIR